MTSTEVGSKVILGSLTLWLSFEKLSLYPHSFMYYHGSWTNITMIVKVCDRESRRGSWFENRLVSSNCYLGNYKNYQPEILWR